MYVLCIAATSTPFARRVSPLHRPTTTAHTVRYSPNPPTLPTRIYTVRFTHTPYETRSLAAPARIKAVAAHE